MAAPLSIDSRRDLEAWLKDRPDRDAVVIATRAALRVAPLAWGLASGRKASLTAAMRRALLVSGVATGNATPEIRNAATNAADAAGGEAAFLANDYPRAVARDAPYAAAYAATAVERAATAAADATAARAAANAAYSAAAAANASDAAWQAVSADVMLLLGGGDPFLTPLWPGSRPPEGFPDPLPHLAWASGGAVGAFWCDWYDNYLHGRPQNLPLLEKIALIDPEDWDKGGKHVDGIIERFLRGEEAEKARPPLDQELGTAASVSGDAISALQSAVATNRQALPPTFDAVEALIALEIERLQNRNYRDGFDREECIRQIGVFMTMNDALKRLRGLIPEDSAPTVEEAEEIGSLATVFRDKISEWPRENATDIVDGGWRVILIGTCAGMFAALGLPAYAGVAAGTMMFGGKKIGEAVKAAKDSQNLGGG